jgi:alkanesulfonate monooxygenase SsuD/methylene tetrahydromethanopterin reductase-like flavin-dependent oxidoreductase (luciferase family)
VVAAESGADADEQFLVAKRNRARAMLGRGRSFSDDEADAILASPAGLHVQQMATYSAVGTPAEVADYLRRFAAHAGADELMVAHQSPSTPERLASVALLAEALHLGTEG